MIAKVVACLLQISTISTFADAGKNQGFCFSEHLPGYYAVIRQTSTDQSKIDRKITPLILSTDGLSGVKSGLYIGTDGVYLDKKEAEKIQAVSRKTAPDTYVKYLGNYSNLSGSMPAANCRHCWIHSQGDKVLQGQFVQKKGWLLKQSGASEFLVESKGEPAENELCATLAGTTGWLVSESVSTEECCTTHHFKLVSFQGILLDEKTISIDDGPTYKTVEIKQDGADPKIVVTSNGQVEGEWSVSGSKFVKTR